MSRPFTPKIVTGNALLDGDVIYLAANGSWTRDLAMAEILDDENTAELRLRATDTRMDEVVGPYLAEIQHGNDGPEAVHFREKFRATGPSPQARGQNRKLEHV